MKVTDLSELEQRLVQLARQTRLNAQAPYSNFLVGAAVIAEGLYSGVGCNVERANYASGSHAEQVAVDSLIAKYGPTRLVAIAIAGAMRGKEPSAPIWPCGHCRQIIWENCAGDVNVRVITCRGDDEVEIATIGELFAKPFGPLDLGVNLFK